MPARDESATSESDASDFGRFNSESQLVNVVTGPRPNVPKMATFVGHDVEKLASEIKNNLNLTSLKSRHPKSFQRASPYPTKLRLEISSRNFCEDHKVFNCACGVAGKNNYGARPRRVKSEEKSKETDNAYEMLQALLQDGSLIKEAVSRLQRGMAKKQYFYESEDESTFSPVHLCPM